MIRTDNIAHVISSLRGRINDFILSRLVAEGAAELSPSHGSILVVLYREGPQTMAALGEKIDRDKSTVTVLVRKLETFGYVKREPGPRDNRVSIIHLTEKGFQFRTVFERISDELVGRIWGETAEKERGRVMAELLRMLERL